MSANEEPALEYRLLSDVSDFDALVQLELDIWQLPPLDAVPTAMMVAFHHNGGLCIGGYWHSRLVALALGFIAFRGEGNFLWSHMAGVHRDFRGRNLGRGIKLAQRRFALERGLTRIGWTYDPLLRGNANFNLRRLGASADTYHINHYGDMQDAINAGLPSDRLEVHWDLLDERVQALAAGGAQPILTQDAPHLLLEQDGTPQVVEVVLNDAPKHCLVEIPRAVETMRREQPQLALSWRLALREALQAAFLMGYRARDFADIGVRCAYVLERN